MEFLNLVLIAPIADMIEYPSFLVEVVFGGLMSGVMYSLVALGFVLIFKASGVFNFAQVNNRPTFNFSKYMHCLA